MQYAAAPDDAGADVAADPEWMPVLDATRARSDRLAGEIEQVRERQRQLEQRISDVVAANRVLRDELVGMGERAALLEDALARQAQARREGARALQLDEVEFLLQLAGERLQLFADRDAALRALELAADSLVHLHDPLLSGVRATLAQEIALLQGAPADPRPALRGELASIQRALPSLPTRLDAVVEDPAERSRLRELLDGLVQVRRVDADGSVHTPLERAMRQSALRLQLTLALAALEAGDRAGWQHALDGALSLFDGLFVGDAPVAGEVRARLQQARAIEPRVNTPPLGAALAELRNLRATRQLARPPDDTPTPAPATPRSAPTDAASPRAPEHPLDPAPANDPAPAVDIERDDSR